MLCAPSIETSPTPKRVNPGWLALVLAAGCGPDIDIVEGSQPVPCSERAGDASCVRDYGRARPYCSAAVDECADDLRHAGCVEHPPPDACHDRCGLREDCSSFTANADACPADPELDAGSCPATDAPTLIWETRLGRIGVSRGLRGRAVTALADGDISVLAEDPEQGFAYLMRLTPAGALLWARGLAPHTPLGLAAVHNGIAVAGQIGDQARLSLHGLDSGLVWTAELACSPSVYTNVRQQPSDTLWVTGSCEDGDFLAAHALADGERIEVVDTGPAVRVVAIGAGPEDELRVLIRGADRKARVYAHHPERGWAWYSEGLDAVPGSTADLDTDAAGNSYVLGVDFDHVPYVAKLDPLGALVWTVSGLPGTHAAIAALPDGRGAVTVGSDGDDATITLVDADRLDFATRELAQPDTRQWLTDVTASAKGMIVATGASEGPAPDGMQLLVVGLLP